MLCTVVLLDTSASMNQRTSSNISLLDAAKAAVPARLHNPSLPWIAVTFSISLAWMICTLPHFTSCKLAIGDTAVWLPPVLPCHGAVLGCILSLCSVTFFQIVSSQTPRRLMDPPLRC